MPMFCGPASTLKSASRLAALRPLSTAWKAAVMRLLTSTLPSVVVFGKMIEPLAPDASTHFAMASPPIAAADASWPVWLMLLRLRITGSKLLVVATGMPSSHAFLTMSS